MTGLLAHGVWLPLVLCHAGVDRPGLPSAIRYLQFEPIFDILDNIRTDGGEEDAGQRGGLARALAICADDADGRPGSHFCCVIWC